MNENSPYQGLPLPRNLDHPGLYATPPVHIEHSLIAAFVKRSKRDRYREIFGTLEIG